MKRNKFIAIALIVVALAYLVSCNKDSQIDSAGTLRLVLTDAPFPVEFIEEAIVTITKIEIRNMDESEEYPFITVFEDTIEINLIELRNGVQAELTEVEIPAGNYDLIRLYVDEATISVKDYSTYNLKVPSGAQTGIKVFIDPHIRVAGGLTEILLDFNLDKSFVLKGNINTPAGIKGFNFKPVIRAVNNSTAGTVQGVVSDTSDVLLANAEVWVEADTVVATAYSDTTGFYAMLGIPEGFYSLYATKENYDTVMYSDVEIVAANSTIKDFELSPKN
ncbi:MAG: DUF4382 domain-containing protein [Bacteroidales bacterium]|nr:DUF4382 domain-containing protein [Bacteroidales bacterium]